MLLLLGFIPQTEMERERKGGGGERERERERMDRYRDGAGR